MDIYKKPAKRQYPIFSLFKFYYYVFKRSPKKYDMMSFDNNNQMYVVFTPFAFFMLSMIFHLVYGTMTGAMWPFAIFAFAAVFMVINTIMVQMVRAEAYRIQRQLDQERREAERLQRQREHEERLRRLYEQMEREKERINREYARQRAQNRQRYDQHQQHERKTNGGTTTDKLRTAYKILGITPTRDTDIIRKAYRDMAKKHHPDTGGDEQRFITIKEAYDLLMKAVKVTAGGV